MRSHGVFFLLTVLAVLLPARGRAEILQTPEGGKFVPVGRDRVACGETPSGWAFTADRRRVRAPQSATPVNRTVEISVAGSISGCAATRTRLTLLATGPVPEIDATSVSWHLDEGRLD